MSGPKETCVVKTMFDSHACQRPLTRRHFLLRDWNTAVCCMYKKCGCGVTVVGGRKSDLKKKKKKSKQRTTRQATYKSVVWSLILRVYGLGGPDQPTHRLPQPQYSLSTTAWPTTAPFCTQHRPTTHSSRQIESRGPVSRDLTILYRVIDSNFMLQLFYRIIIHNGEKCMIQK